MMARNEIRDARPGDEIAALLRLPAPVIWDRYAGGRAAAERLLARLVPRPCHTVSFDCCLLALAGGEPVGVLAGYPRREEALRGRRFTTLSLPRLSPRQWPAAWAILRAGDDLRPRQRPDAWYVDSLAVAPTHRRRGVARALLEAAAERARADGCRAVAIDTDLDNDAAQATYAALGFARGEAIAYEGDRYVPGPGTVGFSRTV